VSPEELGSSKTTSMYFFSHILPLHASLHLHKLPFRIFHTRFHYSHLPILSLHMRLSDSSFPQHALLTGVPYSTSKSLIHTSMLGGEYYSLNLSLLPWIPSYLSPVRVFSSFPGYELSYKECIFKHLFYGSHALANTNHRYWQWAMLGCKVTTPWFMPCTYSLLGE